MFSMRKSWMLVHFVVIFLFISGGATAFAQRLITNTEQQARAQERENRQFENEARQEQSRLFNRAEELYKAKRYEEAFLLFRGVMNFTYSYWDLGTVRRPVGPRGRTGHIMAPATRLSRKRLETNLNTRAADRIRSMREDVRDAAFVEAFGDAQGMFENGDLANSYTALIRLRDAAGVTDSTRNRYNRQINTMLQDIEKEANRLLDKMRESLNDRDGEILRSASIEFRYKFGNFTQRADIADRLRSLTNSADFTNLMREDIAAELLQSAREAFENDELNKAVTLFTQLVNFYQNTDAGREAREDLEAIYGDQELLRGAANEQAREQCEVWLRQARNHVANRQYREARLRYSRIIEYFPETDFAEEARLALEELDRLEAEE